MTDDSARALKKDERLFLLRKLQFLCVLGIVEAQREDRADLDRSKPDDFVFPPYPAVSEADSVALGIRFVNRTCVRYAAPQHDCPPS
jgi:hypothetical protein